MGPLFHDPSQKVGTPLKTLPTPTVPNSGRPGERCPTSVTRLPATNEQEDEEKREGERKREPGRRPEGQRYVICLGRLGRAPLESVLNREVQGRRQTLTHPFKPPGVGHPSRRQ